MATGSEDRLITMSACDENWTTPTSTWSAEILKPEMRVLVNLSAFCQSDDWMDAEPSSTTTTSSFALHGGGGPGLGGGGGFGLGAGGAGGSPLQEHVAPMPSAPGAGDQMHYGSWWAG